MVIRTFIQREELMGWKRWRPSLIPRPDFEKVLYSIFWIHLVLLARLQSRKERQLPATYTQTVVSREEKTLQGGESQSLVLGGIRLFLDNGRPHKTKLVESELVRMRIVELEHPPYSPDLAPIGVGPTWLPGACQALPGPCSALLGPFVKVVAAEFSNRADRRVG